jgi:hypothetical protein
MKKEQKVIKSNKKSIQSVQKADLKQKINYQKPFKLEMSFDEAVERAGKIKNK